MAMAKRTNAPIVERSAKAGRPTVPATQPARVRRRTKSARVVVTKGTTVLQTDRGPRSAWSAAKPVWKKR
jgi:hypothetical protein